MLYSLPTYLCEMIKMTLFQRVALWWKIFRMNANEKRLLNLISNKNVNELDKMYIDFCEKVKQYPVGSQGYKDLVRIHTDIVTNQIHMLNVNDRFEVAQFTQSVICVFSAKIIHLHSDNRNSWTKDVDALLPQEIKVLIDNAQLSQYLVTMKICHDAVLKFLLAQYMSYLLIQYGPTK